MSAQINLYHPRFLKQRDLLTLGHLAIAAVVLYAALAAAGGWAAHYASTRSNAAAAAEAQLKMIKEQAETATQAAANRKPSSKLIAEADAAEGLLRRRSEIVRLLEIGVVGRTDGFADYLRGFALQVPEGLWLTGFTIGSGGNDMEIRGSMLNPASLPEYIRRLGSEKVFQGRSFDVLTMNRTESPLAVRAGPSDAVAPAPTSAPRSIDFVLKATLTEAKETRQ